MRIHRLARPAALLIALLTLIAIPASASAVSPTDPQQWNVGNYAPSYNSPYFLKNMVNKSYVGYGSRTFGVDLVWRSYSTQWQFIPKPPAPNVRDHRRYAIDPTANVAIFNSARNQYLVYGHETFGINLQWSRSPSFQWKVNTRRDDSAASLFNTVANDYVVYGERSFGINLMWLKDVQRAANQNAPGSIHDASVRMNAQQVIQGYVPFLGQYGGGAGFNAVLTRVTNPAGGPPLFFVKPGHSTEQCGDASATTYLAPGTSMTSTQMSTLWGAAQPSLTRTLPFLACAATPYSSVSVNVQYRQL
ncbi:hypothetical protein [Conexibacter sp. CPCC 206217]|uniref:hypothetical protein n=1 Tax=Conexibacter sp. CPCC 206217 TaxID=3064574 RepID=UPI00272418CB|nr:hypothetical protein [Conexibacter sp. CPCC 206217]MDO8213964.1 hypothetical protein [Conexibacter sp. CPCC 206217]